MIIASVLWQGPKSPYHPLHVERLRRHVERHAPKHRFVCLTNAPHWEHPEGIDLIPLEDGNKGWWAKIELFRPGLFTERVLYLDLDVEIVGDLTPLYEFDAPFAAIDDYQTALRGKAGKQINSSVMAFDPGAGDDAYTPEPPTEKYFGDQDWISAAIPDIARFPMTWCPSYRWQVRTFGCAPDAKVIVYHGQPKPWGAEYEDEKAVLMRQGKIPA